MTRLQHINCTPATLLGLIVLSSALSAPLAAQDARTGVDNNSAYRATGPTTPTRPGARTVDASNGSVGLAIDEGNSDGIPDPSVDPTNENEDGAPLRPNRPGQRPIILDGDLSYPREPTQPLDGIIDTGVEAPLPDGTDPTAFDTRPQDDIDLFENPPAGYDPLLFQIEDISPILDRRPRRLFRLEPYDPVGIRVGSFVLFPELTTGFLADSNALSSSRADSDMALEMAPSARFVSDWNVHALEFNASSTLSFYDEFDSEDDRGYRFEARGRLDFTRRTNLQGIVSREQAQEDRSAINANNLPDRTDVTTQTAELALNHRFNRLSLRLRGGFTQNDYSDVTTGSITTVNDERDRDEWRQALRASWEFKPDLSVFGEVEFDQRSFGAPSQGDNIKRDSTGQRYRIGLDFGDIGRILRGEISVGYGVEKPDDNRLNQIEAFLFDANAAWRVTELTTLLLSGRTALDENTSNLSGGVVTHSLGLEARHAFRRHVIGTAGVAYSTRDYDNVVLEEDEWRGTLGLEYFLNREMVLFSAYEHTNFSSSTPASSFTSDEFRLGLRLRR